MMGDVDLLFDNNHLLLNTGTSTDHADTLVAANAFSPGARVVAKIATQYVDAGGGTIIAQFKTCAENTFAAPTVLLTGPTITIAAGAATAAGAPGVVLLDAVIPAGMLRFVQMRYTFSAAMDSGGIDAGIVLDSDQPLDRGL
jgi:hypothetical protein